MKKGAGQESNLINHVLRTGSRQWFNNPVKNRRRNFRSGY